MIYPIILAGGAGTRLWPVSRETYAKQFSLRQNGRSLFQWTLERLSGPGFAPHVVVAADAFRFIVRDQSQDHEGLRIVVEPSQRNTAPAILAAARLMLAEHGDPNAQVLICPSDHMIPDITLFQEAVARASSAADEGKIVVFGVKPDRVETGYGYLELPAEIDGGGIQSVSRYVEKPEAEIAEQFVNSGRHLWSAGIFLFRIQDLLDAFDRFQPEVQRAVTAAVAGACRDLDFIRLEKEAFEASPAISIDFAIMEHADNLAVSPLMGAWSDLGAWDAVWRESDRDDNGVATVGHARAHDCKNTILQSEADGVQVVGIGLENLAVVATGDAVLVAPLDRAQDVRMAVDDLRIAGVPQATTFPRCHRPWGWYETLSLGPRFQVKRIMVRPGGKLSLQSHVHRSEHWVVVQGAASVTVGEEAKMLTENESVYVPANEVHRLENPGHVELHLIEVQTGAYLGEDDITRYEDIYSRNVAG